MAAPITLPAPAPTGTTLVVHADLALRVAADSTTITAHDGAGVELARLATVATCVHDAATATLVAAALTIAAQRALALWPAAA